MFFEISSNVLKKKYIYTIRAGVFLATKETPKKKKKKLKSPPT